MSNQPRCWMCDTEAIVYQDVLGLFWCLKDFEEFYEK